MPAKTILLSDMLASPRKYKRQLTLLFNQLSSAKNRVTQLDQIIQLSNKQYIQLDQRISRKLLPLDFDLNQNLPAPKFDIYAKDKNNIYQYDEPDFSEVEYVMKMVGSKVLIKPKKRFVHLINDENKATRNTALIRLFYPFINRNNSQIVSPKPNGQCLNKIFLKLNPCQLEEKLQITLSLLDEVETLQTMRIRHLHLSPHNIFYDTKENQITIINFHHAQQSDATLSKIPTLPTYLAPEVINKQPNFNSDNYSIGILVAQLFGVTLLQIQQLRYIENEMFGKQITEEMKKNILVAKFGHQALHDPNNFKYQLPPHLTKIIEVTEQLLQTEPNERMHITEAKEKILIAAASSKKNANYIVHDSKLKQGFFSHHLHPATTFDNMSLIEPLFQKIHEILHELPWQKTSRLGGVPKSIQYMRKVLTAKGATVTHYDKLETIQFFCKKNASMAEWRRKLRGRHHITHGIIQLLAEMKTQQVPQLIKELDLFKDQFNTEFGLKIPVGYQAHLI